MTTPAQSAAPNNEPQAPVPGTPEYNAAMAAAAGGVEIQAISPDGKQVSQVADPAAPPAAPDRPAWLPEKFQSAEDMAKAYSELEKKLSAPVTSPAQPTDQQTPPDPNQPPQVPGVDVNKFFSEFSQNGTLSETSYAELAKAGLTKDVVDNYIAGQTAMQNARTQAGYQAVGGEENFKQMVSWAQANMTPAEIQAFNSQVSSPSQEAALLAVQGLQARYTAAVGSAPKNLLGGNASAVAPTSGYQSREQIVQAMSDPRYGADPAYRNSVMQKLMQTADSVI